MRNYKAVIMAGGKGTRLLPVTEKIPKPLAPVLNEPLIARTVRLLLRHEITEIAVTLGHLPHLIIDDLTARFDQDFRYYLEKTPLGTAGGVRAATDFLTGPFFVMSGDTETDIDLTDMARFHEDAGCLATVALTHAENPAGFGMVTVQNGIITGFAEKPDKPVGNLINCGIYAFEPEALGLIPQNGPYDFGREFFPTLVKDSEYSAAAYIHDDYWSDIGTIKALYDANMYRAGGRNILGAGVRLQNGAKIQKNTVIGDGSLLDGGEYSDCIVMEGSVCRGGLAGGIYDNKYGVLKVD